MTGFPTLPLHRPVHAATGDAAEFGGLLHWQAHVTANQVPIVLHAVEFTYEGFTPEAFSRTGIDFPESVRRSVHKRQAEFFFGRLAARDALNRLKLAGGHVSIGVRGEPAWPPGVVGSITHTKGLAMATAIAASSGARGVGIDVEHVLDEQACQAVSSSVVDPQELDYLRGIADLPLSSLLTLAFSAKESLYKGAYSSVQRLFDFSAARVSALDVYGGHLGFTLAENLSTDFVRGQRCRVEFALLPSDRVLTYFAW